MLYQSTRKPNFVEVESHRNSAVIWLLLADVETKFGSDTHSSIITTQTELDSNRTCLQQSKDVLQKIDSTTGCSDYLYLYTGSKVGIYSIPLQLLLQLQEWTELLLK